LGAYDPSGDGKQTSVRELVYLASESLSLFPVFARFGRLRTTGFHLDESRQSWFHWPIWEPELSLRSVRSLLQLSELAHPTEKESELRTRGIHAIYRSRRHEFGKGYGIFRPAQLAVGGSALAGIYGKVGVADPARKNAVRAEKAGSPDDGQKSDLVLLFVNTMTYYNSRLGDVIC